MTVLDAPIKYREIRAYKYVLDEDASCQTPFRPNQDLVTPFITLDISGVLTCRAGYACDGISGPTFDTANTRRAAFYHDALYQLMRLQLLSREEWAREKADRLFYKHLRCSGMAVLRAKWMYAGLRMGGAPATDPKGEARYRKVHTGY